MKTVSIVDQIFQNNHELHLHSFQKSPHQVFCLQLTMSQYHNFATLANRVRRKIERHPGSIDQRKRWLEQIDRLFQAESEHTKYEGTIQSQGSPRTDKLCAACHNMFSRLLTLRESVKQLQLTAYKLQHHLTYTSLDTAAQHGCPLCSLIWASFETECGASRLVRAITEEAKTMLQYKVRLSLPKIIAEKPYQIKKPIGCGIVFNNCAWDVYNSSDILNLSLHPHVVDCEYIVTDFSFLRQLYGNGLTPLRSTHHSPKQHHDCLGPNLGLCSQVAVGL